ncbi:sodium:proton antiporter [Thiomicrospira aerophila AL3]|uniref:Sodium:proton antiporter n=1 Tax=Thiomicrospira aerophila AL3 TaxID=717772 RepID=W0DVB3_9GAMM|nr:Na+/H+ antiporter subunit E [Thiomicrospira aerophila]AHF00806.1 sodium:proton antiporter [Thiomicrospira aerophila AL3]
MWIVLRRIVVFWLLSLMIWWSLADGQLSSFALIWTLAAALLMHKLWPPLNYALHWRYVPSLILLFVRASVLGGWDVSRRAIQAKPSLHSCYLDYYLQLPEGWARSVWVSLIGLFPGTLTVAVSQKWVRIHLLDDSLNVHQDLQALEGLLAKFIGVEIHPSQQVPKVIAPAQGPMGVSK